MIKREQQILDLLADGRERAGYQIANELRYRWWQMPVYWHLGKLEEAGKIERRVVITRYLEAPDHLYRIKVTES